ncbi:MAG: glycerol-3-phosphate 1-O-acyltransferase PlsY [Syntrophomonadaceae bacterium]
MKEIVFTIACYLIGSVPFSYLFSRYLGGVDIRSRGTGNVGATNVLRTLGMKIALLSLLGDVLKGVLAAWLGLAFGGEGLAALCTVAVVTGHCWPLFLDFRGGKGVATSAGALMVLMPLITLILLVTFVTIIAVSRYVSLGSVCAAVLLPLLALVMQEPWQYLLMSVLLAGMVLFRHRTNIERLRQGCESKLGQKS